MLCNHQIKAMISRKIKKYGMFFMHRNFYGEVFSRNEKIKAVFCRTL